MHLRAARSRPQLAAESSTEGVQDEGDSPIDGAARNRWLQLMGRALEETGLPPDAADLLREFFDAVSTMMINRPA